MAIDPTNKVINYNVFQERLLAQQAAREASNKDKAEKLTRKNLTDSSKTKKTKSPFFLSFEPEEILGESLELEEIKNNYPEFLIRNCNELQRITKNSALGTATNYKELQRILH